MLSALVEGSEPFLDLSVRHGHGSRRRIRWLYPPQPGTFQMRVSSPTSAKARDQLILAVLKLNPHLRGMLCRSQGQHRSGSIAFYAEDPSSRCQLIVADLTQSVPAGAMSTCSRMSCMGSKNAEAIAILKNCRAVIPRNGTLLIIECILPRWSQADPQLEGRLIADLGMLLLPAAGSEVKLDGKHF